MLNTAKQLIEEYGWELHPVTWIKWDKSTHEGQNLTHPEQPDQFNFIPAEMPLSEAHFWVFSDNKACPIIMAKPGETSGFDPEDQEPTWTGPDGENYDNYSDVREAWELEEEHQLKRQLSND